VYRQLRSVKQTDRQTDSWTCTAAASAATAECSQIVVVIIIIVIVVSNLVSEGRAPVTAGYDGQRSFLISVSTETRHHL